MVIQWYGQSCFRIQSGDLLIAVDPFSKEIGLTPPRFRTDIVLVTHAHYDHDNVEALAGNPFVVAGPGEYEMKGVHIQGIPTFHDRSQGKERGTNTVYRLALEGLRLVHLGDFGEGVLRDDTLEEIGDVDIAMVPVGGTYTIGAEDASRVVKQLEPRFVIPMHYRLRNLGIVLAPVDDFLKEMGGSPQHTADRFTVRKKDVGEEEKTETILLSTQ
jgi:L-ascorbate metabolism protein UlaG (beta-lactamase superfamily)